MDKIIIKIPGAPEREFELAPGVHKVGRSINTDLQIDHPSVSGSHCEIIVNDGTVTVKDIGSTNGVILDGQRMRECNIVPGQALRLGEAEIRYKPAPISPAPYQVHLIPPGTIRRPKDFYKCIPSAFVYPFNRNGLFLLGGGTFVFGAFNLFLRLHGLIIARAIAGGMFATIVTGYSFLYMQKIITSTAFGDDKMPPFPDYENWWDSAFEPYFRLLGISAACIAPGILGLMYAGRTGLFMFIPLLILGACYAPMALLAVAMDDSLLGLNPELVVPSILRVPMEYLVIWLLLGAFVTLVGGLSRLADGLHQTVAGQLLATFLSLYFAVVAMRLLGLLYFTRKARLGWRA